MSSHVAVWLDHLEARVFHIGADKIRQIVLHATHSDKHIHHKANSIGDGRAGVDRQYFDRIADEFSDANAILIAGPAEAKTAFMSHLKKKRPKAASSVVSVETLPKCTDGEFADFAKRLFKSKDRLSPQTN